MPKPLSPHLAAPLLPASESFSKEDKGPSGGSLPLYSRGMHNVMGRNAQLMRKVQQCYSQTSLASWALFALAFAAFVYWIARWTFGGARGPPEPRADALLPRAELPYRLCQRGCSRWRGGTASSVATRTSPWRSCRCFWPTICENCACGSRSRRPPSCCATTTRPSKTRAQSWPSRTAASSTT